MALATSSNTLRIAARSGRAACRINARRNRTGCGSFEKDSPIKIVAREKEEKAWRVALPPTWKRERHADKTSETLSQCVLPSLHMGCFPGFFSDSRVLFTLRLKCKLGQVLYLQWLALPVILVCTRIPTERAYKHRALVSSLAFISKR